MAKEFIEKMLSYPQRGQIQVQFDAKLKIFSLSVPIFSAIEGVPASIKQFVESRQSKAFKPHQTTFHLEPNKVMLTQQIPFGWDFQSTLRRLADQFWQLSQHCHELLSDLDND